MRTAALLAALSASPVPTPIGVGPAYHPLPLAPAVRAAAPVAGLSCRHGAGSRYGVHVELFANRRVVIVPAGIGIAPAASSGRRVRSRRPVLVRRPNAGAHRRG